MKPSKIFCVFILFGGTLVASDVRFSESFNEPVGGLPEGWLAASAIEDGIGASIAPVPGSPGTYGLLIQRPAGRAPDNTAVYYTGTPDGVTDGQFKDFSGSVLISGNKGPQSTRGVVIRANSPSYGNFEGYYVALVSETGNEGIGIYRDPISHTEPGEQIAFERFTENLSQETEYLLKFSAKGPTIEASLWTVDPMGNALKILASTMAEGVRTNAGMFGFRGGYGNSGPINSWFRSLSLETH